MAVSTTDAISGPYLTNGATTAFPFTFKAPSTSEVSVLFRDPDGFELVPPSYSVSINPDAGGTITFVTAPADGNTLLVLLDPHFTQDLEFENGSAWLAEPVNEGYDRSALRDQVLRRDVNRSILAPLGEAGLQLPPAASRKGKFLGFSAVDGAVVPADSTDGDGILRPDLASDDAGKGAALVAYRPDRPGAAGETTKAALDRTVWADQYKYIVDLDDTACIERALNSGASKILFQDRDYLISGLIVVAGIKFLQGDVIGCSRFVQTDLTADLLHFAVGFAQGGGLADITLTSDVASFGGRGSTGVALTIDNPNDNFVCQRFEVVSYDKQILVTGGYQPHFRDFRCLFFTDYALRLAGYSAGHEIAGSQWQSGKMSNLGFGGDATASIGMLLEQASGEFFRDIDITMVGQAVVMRPPANSWVRFARFANVLADSCFYEGWTIDGGVGGYVLDIEFDACWASGSGGGAYRPAGSDRGAGLLIKGIGVDDIRWLGGTLRDNDCGGVDLQDGTNVRLQAATISRNSRRLGYSNVYPGVRVRANVSSWTIEGCSIGNFSQGVFDVQQAEGVVIDAGASANFKIVGSDLSNPGPGKAPLLNQSTSLNYVLSGNTPRRALGLNASERQALRNLCGTAIAAGAASFVGPNGIATDAFTSVHIMDRPGAMAKTRASVPAAPGAGQSYTYTVYLNGVATGMTGQITGSALTAEITGAFLYSDGDLVTTQIVPSAGAAAVRHNVVNVSEP